MASFPSFDRTRLLEIGCVKKSTKSKRFSVAFKPIEEKRRVSEVGFEENSKKYKACSSKNVARRSYEGGLARENLPRVSLSSFADMNKAKITKQMDSEKNSSVNKAKDSPSDDPNPTFRPTYLELQRGKPKRPSQGAFDQVVEEEPISKKHFKGGILSVMLEKLIREKEYQTTISRAIISSAESDYRTSRNEFVVDNSAEQHASYCAWGTQMVEVSDSVRLAVRQNERAILRPNSNQKKKFSLMPSKEVFRAMSTVIKISSADSKRVLAGYVKT